MITKYMKKTEGFSLTELMVVLVIIGILVLLALPRFMPIVNKAKTVEAQINLKQVHMLQQAYRFQRDRYSDDLHAIGYEQERLVTEGGNARYQVTMEHADVNSFVARATSVVPLDGRGTINIWEVDETGEIKEVRDP